MRSVLFCIIKNVPMQNQTTLLINNLNKYSNLKLIYNNIM